MGLKWYDQHVSWDPSSFGNISVIPASDSDIFHPDVQLINAWVSRTTKLTFVVFAYIPPRPVLILQNGSY